MRIACPDCAATYEVPDGQIRPGRMMQCAQCNLRWAPVTEADEIALPAVAPRNMREVAPEAAREAAREAVAEPVPERVLEFARAAADDGWAEEPSLAVALTPPITPPDRPAPAQAAPPAGDAGSRLAQELTFHVSSRTGEPALPPGEGEPAGPLGLRRAAAAPVAASALAAPARPGGWTGLLARVGGAVGAGWVASVALVCGGLAAMGVWRAAIMLAWPPAIRLYAWIGLLPPQG